MCRRILVALDATQADHHQYTLKRIKRLVRMAGGSVHILYLQHGHIVPGSIMAGSGLGIRTADDDVEPQIKIEVSEEDKAYKVKAEIPAVKKEDIQVSVDGNRVSISAEVKKEKEEKKDEKVIRSERYYGKVSRSFLLGEEVDQGAVQAKYTDGVLDLTPPKKPGAQAKKITVM